MKFHNCHCTSGNIMSTVVTDTLETLIYMIKEGNSVASNFRILIPDKNRDYMNKVNEQY